MEEPVKIEDLEKLAGIYKTLANPKRLRMLLSLKKSAMTFSSFLKELGDNPKVLKDNLDTLISHGLVFKSFQHENYVLTPIGHIVVEKLVGDGYSLLKLKEEKE